MGDLELPTKIAPSREQIHSHGRDHGHEPRDSGFDYESKVWGVNDVRLSPKYLNALRLKYCLEDLKDVQGKVLEVGCGAGGMARAIKFYRQDLDVHGMDIGETAIHEANVNSSEIKFTVGDAYHLAYPKEHFSAVVVFDVLEHLDFPDWTIGEIFRVLKPGGIFHLFVPCEGNLYTLQGFLTKIGWRALETYGGHIQRFHASSVRIVLERQGFMEHNIRWSGHFFNQVFTVSFFTFLLLRRKNLAGSFESYLEGAKRGLAISLLGLMKNIISWMSYYESSLLRGIPAWGAHIMSIKQEARSQSGRM